MKRRTVIKQLALASGAFLLMPSCMPDKSKASILLKSIRVDGEQEKMMAELAETIIPKTNTPGAKDISAHLFALLMVDDCYKAADQQKFMAGMAAFETKTEQQFGKSFSKSSADEKQKLLNELENSKADDTDIAYFYKNIKKLTIQAYTTSKFYLTEVHVYKLIPGRYSGCVSITNAS